MILKVDPGGTFFKTSPRRKTISKQGDGTHAEIMDNIGTKFNGKVKGEHWGRIYVDNTITISEHLHSYQLVQRWNGGGDSEIR